MIYRYCRNSYTLCTPEQSLFVVCGIRYQHPDKRPSGANKAHTDGRQVQAVEDTTHDTDSRQSANKAHTDGRQVQAVEDTTHDPESRLNTL
ncbi:MAG: hypothetical protein VZR53_19785, partial [Prevotella sp.]|nr:hypothetical protein [Prevotella sp.]